MGHVPACHEVITYHCLDLRQVSDLDYKWVQYLAPPSSAPGESPHLLLKTANGTIPDVRHDVVKARAIVTEVHHGFVDTHTMVFDIHRNMLKVQEGADGQYRSVSDTRALSITG